MFRIHPTILRRRRKRCKPIVEKVLKLEWEMVLCCNICGANQNVMTANRDRYGFPIRTALCLNCGLVYIIDRLTADSYSVFYRQWYRPLLSRFKGYEHTPGEVRRSQTRYASMVADATRGYLKFQEPFSLLDIGGSTGGISLEFIRRYRCSATVLDPAPDEITVSQKLGLNAIVGTLETWNPKDKYDLILLCRTLEHLYDLKSSLSKIRNLISPGGLLYCDFTDFVDTCRKTGSPEAVTKLDHCYYLTQETAPDFLGAAGFEIVSINILVPGHVGFLMCPCEPSTLQLQTNTPIRKLIRTLQNTTSDWEDFGRTSYDVIDWGRKKAYRIKEKIKDFRCRSNG